MTKIKLEVSTKPDPEWNQRMIKSGYGTIYQSVERGLFLEKENVPNYYLKFCLPGGKIIGQLLISIRERFSNSDLKARIFKNMPLLKQKNCEWSYGPIIFDSTFTNDVYVALEEFLLSKNFRVNGWTHPLITTQPNMTKNFQIRKWGTFLVDLTKSEDEVYSNIEKHSGRKNIERSIKRGVKVKQLDDDSIKDYYDLVKKFKNDSSRSTTGFEIFRRRWKTFQSLGFSGFLATKENIPIGGLLFTFVNGHIIEIGVARSEIDTQKNLYSQDLIKWKIMEWGIKNKMKYYDLTGFNPEPISPKEEGIIKYKKKWGGKPYYYSRIISKKNPLRR